MSGPLIHPRFAWLCGHHDASSLTVAGDRGLAYDLVGDNSAAQEQYSRALNGADGDEVRRRLALSHAIQGNREAFEKALYPLLERRDLAAYRVRAFGLAVDGEERAGAVGAFGAAEVDFVAFDFCV